MTKRCTGHCCYGFTLPNDILIEIYHTEDSEREVKYYKDEDYIKDMIIPLYWVEDTKNDPTYYEGSCRFTCKHFDGESCTAYEARPRMCSEYPYGSACKFKGCTMEQPKLVQIDTSSLREVDVYDSNDLDKALENLRESKDNAGTG